MHKIKPELTVCIPTFNRGRELLNTLSELSKSQFIQHKAIIIIVDNASDDNTVEVCRKAQALFSNLIVIRNKFNIGLCANYLRCLENVSTEYVWVIGDDDDINAKEIDNSFQEILDLNPTIASLSNFKRNEELNGFYGEITKLMKDHNSFPFFLHFGFFPSAMIKVSLIPSEVYHRCYQQTPYLYPHMPILEFLASMKGSTIYFTKTIIAKPGGHGGTSWAFSSWIKSWLNISKQFLSKEFRLRSYKETFKSNKPRSIIYIYLMCTSAFKNEYIKSDWGQIANLEKLAPKFFITITGILINIYTFISNKKNIVSYDKLRS